METSKIITIPNHWTSPKYSLGQRTKQGVIIGIEYYPPGSSIAAQYGALWQYAVLVNENDDYLKHLLESEIQPLSTEELRVLLLNEIEVCKQKITVLTQQLIAIDQG